VHQTIDAGSTVGAHHHEVRLAAVDLGHERARTVARRFGRVHRQALRS
jgi:hypothetical protein